MPKLIDILRNAAPAIGSAMTVFGGPLGAAGGAVLTGLLGLPKDADEKAITKALEAATPEQLLAIRQADNDFALKMKQASNELAIKMREADTAEYATDAADRASARARDTAAGPDVVNNITMTFLAAFALALLLLLIYLVVTQPIQETARDIIFLLVGSITGYVTQVFNYYFGSSSGSKTKTDAINQMAVKQTPK
jgi:hypothetical protein